MDHEERKRLEKSARGPLAGRVRTALIEAGFGHGKASTVARALGVAPNTVYRMRAGTFAPSIFTLASIAKMTGRPMEWFVADFRHPAIAVFREWKRERPQAPADLVALLEGVETGDALLTGAFYDVALMGLMSGLTLDAAIASARATLAA